MDTESAASTAQAWQAAVNAHDIERLLMLSGDNIELIGPRGSGKGHRVLKEWVNRAGLNLATKRVFVRGDSVVVEQHGVWRSNETGAATSEADLASRYQVAHGRIVEYQRYDNLEDALKGATLTFSDEALPG